MTLMPFGDTVDGCVHGAQRGVDWLLDQQRPDGSWRQLEREVLDAYYKGSWALAVAGHMDSAHRLLTHVGRSFLASDGSLEPRFGPLHTSVAYQYSGAYVVVGAQKLDRYEIAAPALRFLLSQQDAQHGGFYSLRASAGRPERADTMSTGMCGVACLAAGRLDAARRAGDCLAAMVEMQPAPAARHYTALDADGRLITAFPPEAAIWRVVDAAQPEQRWFGVGLPFTFAVLLHLATGEPRDAQLADDLLAFQARGLDAWDVPSSGKAGWGCSMLYRATGEERYRQIALRVARRILSYQAPSGRFTIGPATEPAAGEQAAFPPATYDVTAEFVLWLSLIAANLRGRDG